MGEKINRSTQMEVQDDEKNRFNFIVTGWYAGRL